MVGIEYWVLYVGCQVYQFFVCNLELYSYLLHTTREQSFNCGKDNPYAITVGHLAAMHRAAFFVTTSGGVSVQCNASKDTVPFASSQWTPQDAQLSSVQFGRAELSRLKREMIEMHSFGPSASRWETSWFLWCAYLQQNTLIYLTFPTAPLSFHLVYDLLVTFSLKHFALSP